MTSYEALTSSDFGPQLMRLSGISEAGDRLGNRMEKLDVVGGGYPEMKMDRGPLNECLAYLMQITCPTEDADGTLLAMIHVWAV